MSGKFAFGALFMCFWGMTEATEGSGGLCVNGQLFPMRFFVTFSESLNDGRKSVVKEDPFYVMKSFEDACTKEGIPVSKESAVQENDRQDGVDSDILSFIQQVLDGKNGEQLSKDDLKNRIYSTLFLANEKLCFCGDISNNSNSKQLREEAFSLIGEIQSYKNRDDFNEVMHSDAIAQQVKELKGYSCLDKGILGLLQEWSRKE